MTKRSQYGLLSAFFFAVAVVLLLMSAPLWAGDECRGNSCNGGGDVTVGGDTVNVGGDTITMEGGDLTSGPVNVSTGGNRSLALGNVLGDVDIAGCLGSTQWSTPVYGKQKLSLNWVCVAEFYIRYQQPELAAMALCNTDILKEFSSEEECEQAHRFLVQAAIPVAEERVITESSGEDEELHVEQRMLRAKIDNLEAELEKAKRPVYRTEVVQRGLTDEQKAALREVKQ